MFKAIEVHADSRRHTGREYVFNVDTRQAAIEALLGVLGRPTTDARVDPTRTMVKIDEFLWTIVATAAGPATSTADEAPNLRRAGAKHKRVR
jgi:hypothetical protein